MDNRPASFRMYLAAFSALSSAMALGCVLGWSGIALSSLKKNGSEPQIRTIEINGTIETNLEDREYATWISSCTTLAAMAGSFFGNFIIQFAGARKTLIGIGLPLIIGWACINFAKSFPMIIVGRVITGLCMGIICSTTPGYISDIVTPNTRAFLGASFQVLICFGQLYLISFGTFLEWNQLGYLAIVPAILCSMGMFFAPESPIKLLESGAEHEAHRVLTLIRGRHSDIDIELKELKNCVKSKAENASSGFGLIKRTDVYQPAIVTVFLMMFQQFSGVNGVLFYLSNIFENGSSIKPNVAAIMVDGALVIATLVSALVMEKFGRKRLLIISSVGNALSLMLMGVYYMSIEPNASWMPVAFLMIFMCTFSLGLGPIPWMIVSEITPNEAIPLISSLGSAVNWLCAFLITKNFDALIDVVHNYGAYWLFSAICVLSVIYTYFFVPETKQRTIEEIQQYFRGKKY